MNILYLPTKTITSFINLSGSKKCMIVLIVSCMCLIGFDCIGQVPMIRLKMNGVPNYLDETVLYYQEGATDDFDSDYDAYKISGPNCVPQISQDFNSTLMQINGISPVASTFSINIKTTTNITGNFTITATDFAFLPLGTCVKLNDLVAGTSVNILAAPYVFNLLNTTTSSRFVLEITHYNLPVTSELFQPTCQLMNGGKLRVNGNIEAPWNYVWKDSIGAIIKTSLSSLESDSLTGLNSGNYSVEITSVNNNCYSYVSGFTINPKLTPTISFSSPDTVTTSILQNFLPTNASENCDSYYWSFGDGFGSSTDFEPAYSYSSPGIYEIKLIGANLTGCMDSTTKYINVIDLATAIKSVDDQPIQLLNNNDNQFVLNLNTTLVNEVNVNLYNLEGKCISTEHFENLNGVNHVNLNFNQFTSGFYIINIVNHSKSLICTKLIIE